MGGTPRRISLAALGSAALLGLAGAEVAVAQVGLDTYQLDIWSDSAVQVGTGDFRYNNDGSLGLQDPTPPFGMSEIAVTYADPGGSLCFPNKLEEVTRVSPAASDLLQVNVAKVMFQDDKGENCKVPPGVAAGSRDANCNNWIATVTVPDPSKPGDRVITHAPFVEGAGPDEDDLAAMPPQKSSLFGNAQNAGDCGFPLFYMPHWVMYFYLYDIDAGTDPITDPGSDPDDPTKYRKVWCLYNADADGVPQEFGGTTDNCPDGTPVKTGDYRLTNLSTPPANTVPAPGTLALILAGLAAAARIRRRAPRGTSATGTRA